MTLFIIINVTLGHYVTTQTDEAKAEEFLADLMQGMEPMEYALHRVEIPE